MILTSFVEGPQQTKGRGNLSCGQWRAREWNMNFCRASLQVTRMRLHKHWAYIQMKGGNSRGKINPKHTSFTLSSFKKKKEKQNSLTSCIWNTKDGKNGRNKFFFKPCNNTYCIQCAYYSRTFPRGSRCYLRSWYNAIQVLNEETWRSDI